MSRQFRILLDAGHGAGKEHNRGGLHFNEGDNNYRYSLVLKKELEKIPGVKVDLVRTIIGQNPSVSARAAKGAGYDLFLSLHSNAASAGVRGTEIFDSVERPNRALADKLVRAISNAFGHNNRGTKYKKNSSGTNWYGVLRNNRAKSSMIIEHGFHTNRTDSLFFRDNHAKIAKATADVIRSHYGLGSGTATPSAGGNTVSNIYYGIGSPHNTRAGVRKLQQDLIKLGHPVGSTGADGHMGKNTRAGIISFQKKHGLEQDGFAGKATLAKIGQLIAAKNKPKPTPPKPTGKIIHRVQVGAYADIKNAERLVAELKRKGYEAIIKTESR